MKSHYLAHLKENKQTAMHLMIYKAPQSECLANSCDTLRRMIFFILVSAQSSVIFTCLVHQRVSFISVVYYSSLRCPFFFFFRNVYASLVSLFLFFTPPHPFCLLPTHTFFKLLKLKKRNIWHVCP